MNGKDVTMRIKIDTVLGDMSKAVTGLQDGLTKGLSKIDVGSSIGKSLSKNIQQFKEEYNKFSSLTAGGTEVKFSNSKEAIQSGERLSKLYREIQAQVGSLGDASTASLKKLFPDSFDGRIDQIRGSLNSLQSAMIAIGQKDIKFNEASAEAQQLEQKLTTLRGQLVDTADQMRAVAEAEKEVGAANIEQEAAEKALDDIKQQAEATKASFESLKAEFQKKINLNAQSVLKEIDTLDEEITELTEKKEKLLKGGDKAGAAAIQEQIESKQQTKRGKERTHSGLISASAKVGKAKDPTALAEYAAKTGDAKEQTEMLAKAQALAEQQEQQANKMAAAEERAKAARDKSSAAIAKQESAQEALNTANKKNERTQAQIDKTTKSWEAQKAKVNELSAELEGMRTKLSTKGLSSLKELIPGFDENKLKTTEGIQEIIAQLDTMDNKKADQLRQELLRLGKSAEQVEGQVGGIRGAMGQVGEGAKDIQRAASEFDQLKNRVQYFFGITNSIQLFKRAVTSALNTVKELDATMTEAAVVTDFSVGDMWDKLPEYSANAQKLGVSINSMYQATTLYYQQGLKTNEAMALGVETMKMAKIAGMESAEATEAMTAALRGFNMELNEASATRVNDVYSQLAAVTAADTEQIATAMSKTASIAASANMEFETTAALLAQIIETTQEAPETAGTAMKTIIARFSEVKNLKASGQSSGQDEEGEAIDVNKIQTALRSVGISMEGYFNGTERLDSVLLKLAEKWNTLDFETQRYIATMAAGSRQQSRFIAMMSDYERTMELVGEAQNSNGASQKQFEKTQESLSSSLTKLKNAWDEFLMGLANNDILKFAVDFLTTIVSGVNGLIKALSGGNGLIKSILTLIATINLLKVGKKMLGGTLGFVGQSLGIGSVGQAAVEQQDNPDQMVEREMVRNPQQQGERAGEKAGQGFVAGWKRATGKEKGTFFTSPAIKQEREKALKQNMEHGARVDLRKIGKARRGDQDGAAYDRFMKELDKRGMNLNEEQKLQIKSEFDSKGVDAAINKYEKLGGQLLSQEEQLKLAGKQSRIVGTDYRALGQSIAGVGTAITLVTSLLQSMGLISEDTAKTMSTIGMAIMGVGSAISMLPGLIKTVESVAVSAGIKVQTAWWWLLIIAAVLAAIVGLVIAVNNALDKTSDTKQLEKLSKKMTEVAEAAQRIKKELDSISEAKQNLESMGKTLEGLTEGSNEWKKALMENNEQVLNLLDTYPELSQYVTHGPNGQLSISSEGFDKLESKKLDAYAANTSLKALLGNQVSRKQQEIDARLLLEKERGLGDLHKVGRVLGFQESVEKSQTGGLNYKQFNDFAEQAAKMGYAAGDFSLTVERTKEILAGMNLEGVDATVLQNALIQIGSDFDVFSAEVWAAREAEKARMQATIDSVAATSDLVTNSEKFAQVVKEATAENSQDYSDEIIAEAEKDLAILNKTGKRFRSAQEEIYSEYAKQMGYGDAAQVKAKVESGEISRTEVAYGLASKKANDVLVKQMEALTTALENLEKRNSNTATLMKRMLSEEGGQLTLEDLKKTGFLKTTTDGQTQTSDFTADNVEDRLQMTGNEIIQVYTGLGMSTVQEFVDYLNQQAKLAKKSYDASVKIIKKQWPKISDGIVNTLSSSAAKGLATNANALGERGVTDEQASDMMTRVQAFLANTGYSEEKQKELFEIFAQADWTSVESLEQVAAIWATELGENSGAMVNLFSGIKELTRATSELTQAQLNEKGFAKQDIISKILSGELDPKKMTKDTMESVISVLGESFRKEFIQIGSDVFAFYGDLANALRQSGVTSEQRTNTLEEKKNNYEKQVAYQEAVAGTSTATAKTLVASDAAIAATYGDGGAYDVNNTDAIYIPNLDTGKAHEGQVEFQELMKKYIAKDPSVTIEQLWAAYQKQNPSAQIQGMDLTTFTTRVNNERAAVSQQAGNLGATTGYTTQDNGEADLLGEQVNDIVGNAQLYIDSVNEGNDQLKDYIYQVYSQIFTAINKGKEVAPQPIDQISIDDMIAYIKSAKQQFGNGQYGAISTTDAIEYGAGVASSSGLASQYDYTSELLTDDQQKAANESYNKTVDVMHDNLGASAFSDEVSGVTDQMAGDMEKYNGELKDAEGNTFDLDRVNKIFAVDMAQVYDRVKQAKKGFEEYQDVLVAGKRDTPEYAAAMEQVKTSLATLFNVGAEDIDKMIEKGLITPEQIEAMVQGDSNAFGSIADAIHEQALRGMLLAETDISDTELQVWLNIEGRVDDKLLAEQLAAMDANLSIHTEDGRDKLEQMYAAMGKTIEFVVDKEGKTVSAVVKDQDIKNAFARAPSGKGGGGGSSWTNQHDKFYNTYEKINRLLRERDKIERQYDKLLKKRGVTYKDFLKNQKEQLENLKQQQKQQQHLVDGKTEQIQDLMSSKEGKKYKDYYTYDEKTGQIQIDWDKVNKLKGEKGEGFDEFLSKLEGLRDQFQEAQDALDEIEDSVEEVEQQGKEDYLDFEDQIKEALLAERQKEIDKLSDINDSINDTNSKILDSLQQQIDEYRQNRDNEKTEEELSDKQRRLAYLQQDTSGANAMEILSLQKEIEEGQESYTDQLIDQKISELQKQNDQAAEQRERQIALAEAQLKHYEESGEVWNDVYALLNDPNNILDDDTLNPDGPLAKLLKDNDAYAGMSKIGQAEWWQQIAAQFASAFAYVNGGVTPKEGETIEFTDGNGNKLEGKVDENGNVVVGDQVYSGVHQNERGEWVTDDTGKTVEKKEEEQQTKGSGKIASLPGSSKLSASQVKNLQKGLNELLKDGELSGYSKLDEDGSYGPKTKAAVKKLQAKIGISADGVWGPNTKKAFDASSLKAYKAGGLADFTGPAWLDGTKSKPEYILSADQTKAFFTLVDILSDLTTGTAKSSEKTGDTSYDIDINVESIGSDYDVEQMASKIKSLINEDARYRNNNAINLMR